MLNKGSKECSLPLLSREPQIDPVVMIYLSYSPEWQKWLTIPSVDKDVNTLEFSYIIGGNTKCYNHFSKVVSYNINHALIP